MDVVVVVGLVLGWYIGRKLRERRRMRRDAAAQMVREMDRGEARVWLSEDVWEQRCPCGRWGLPAGGWVIIDEWGNHDADRCQPERETVR